MSAAATATQQETEAEPPNLGTRMTVGDLRKAIANLPDAMPVELEIDNYDDYGDIAQSTLRKADVEERCDEVPRLYLFGSWDDDTAEAEKNP